MESEPELGNGTENVTEKDTWMTFQDFFCTFVFLLLIFEGNIVPYFVTRNFYLQTYFLLMYKLDKCIRLGQILSLLNCILRFKFVIKPGDSFSDLLVLYCVIITVLHHYFFQICDKLAFLYQ